MADAGSLDTLLRNKKVLFAGAGAAGGILSGVLTLGVGLDEGTFSSWVIAGGLDAALIGVALVYAQYYYQTRALGLPDGVKLAGRNGMIGGCAGGLVALLGMTLFGAGDFGRLVGWAISGAVAGYVVSQQVRNLKRKPAILAGAAGGAAGCLILYLDLGYAAGVGITGAAIGLMVALAEVIFRKNWIDVEIYAKPLGTGLNLAKPLRQYTLTIGAEPITIGTRDGADIRLNDVPGMAPAHVASIYSDGDKTILHDLRSGAREELRSGEPFVFGECKLSLGS